MRTHHYYTRDPHDGVLIGVVRGAPPPEGYLWREESAVPHGDWYQVHPNLERRDALRTYRHLITGEQVQRVIARYYSRPSSSAPQGHDVCLYCGADNGLHGELRDGWDCHLCGGNCASAFAISRGRLFDDSIHLY